MQRRTFFCTFHNHFQIFFIRACGSVSMLCVVCLLWKRGFEWHWQLETDWMFFMEDWYRNHSCWMRTLLYKNKQRKKGAYKDGQRPTLHLFLSIAFVWIEQSTVRIVHEWFRQLNPDFYGLRVFYTVMCPYSELCAGWCTSFILYVTTSFEQLPVVGPWRGVWSTTGQAARQLFSHKSWKTRNSRCLTTHVANSGISGWTRCPQGMNFTDLRVVSRRTKTTLVQNLKMLFAEFPQISISIFLCPSING